MAKGNKTASPTKKTETTKVAIEPGFFGEQIHAGHALVCENPDEDLAFQLAGAALASNAAEGRTTLYVSTERRDVKIALCTLDKDKAPQWTLNNTFSPMDGSITFTTDGPNAVHLTGYVDAEMDEDVDDDEMGMYGGPDDEDDDDDDDEGGFLEVVDEEDESDEEDADEVEDSGRFEVIEDEKEEKPPKKESPKKESPKKEDKKAEAKETKKEAKKEAKKDDKKRPLEDAESLEVPKKAKSVQMRKGGVTIEDHTIGKGKEATKGKKVQILYKGTLAKNGKQFDANLNRKSPFSFRLGVGDVIKGFDIGVEGMRVGGKRTVNIPSKMGYGREGAGRDIPPNSDLVFEIELVNA